VLDRHGAPLVARTVEAGQSPNLSVVSVRRAVYNRLEQRRRETIMATDDKAGDKAHADIAGMSFEDAMRELESIVHRLEGGEIDLEASIDIYSRGTELKTHCEAKLKAAQSRVEKIVSDGAGNATGTEPFDVD
jgi:exodeoxyribonuclease VII small subunit